jgi:hydroxymethylbilane synthase
VLSADGRRAVDGARSGPIEDAETIGRALAEDLVARGAAALIEAARAR